MPKLADAHVVDAACNRSRAVKARIRGSQDAHIRHSVGLIFLSNVTAVLPFLSLLRLLWLGFLGLGRLFDAVGPTHLAFNGIVAIEEFLRAS